MRQLSGQDASFIYQEQPHAPLNGASLNIYDQSTARGGRVTFRGILQDIERRLHLAPVLRERLVRVPMDLDHPYWVRDSEFDLEFHVRHLALPEPGDWRQLCIQAARLLARPMDLTRPPWELYVIEGVDGIHDVPSGSYAMFMKTHHAAIDGSSGRELTAVLHDLDPRAEPPAPTEEWHGEDVPESWELLAKAGANNAMRMARFGPSAWSPSSFATSQPPRSFSPPAVPPRTRFNGTVSSHRVFDAIVVPFEGMRATRGAVPGATINDVVLAVVGGALRRYLLSKNELPLTPLVAMIPVSVREPDATDVDGNQVAAMTTALGTHIANPVERLAAIHEATKRAKAALHAIGARRMMEIAEIMPGALVALAARQITETGAANFAHPNYNTVVTNVPGPEHALYSLGAKLIRPYGLSPVHDGMGLMNCAQTYLGEMYLSFTACRTMMPDPALYAESLRDAHDELVSAAAPADSGKTRAARQAKPPASKKGGR
jgi:diacylglycerol O-acyltransferase / wax synthase